MSNELIDPTTMNYDEMASHFGLDQDPLVTNKSSIPTAWFSIKSSMKLDGKKYSIPRNVVAMFHPEHDHVFFENPSFRYFQRFFQFKRWDAGNEEWENKSELVHNFRTQQGRDEQGTVNCGKSTSFIDKDEWESMSKEDQDYQKGARLYRVLYAVIGGDAVDINGDPVEVDDILVKMNIGRTNQKSVDETFDKFIKDKIIPPTKEGFLTVEPDDEEQWPLMNIDMDWTSNVILNEQDALWLDDISKDVRDHNHAVVEKYNAALNESVNKEDVTDVEGQFVDIQE